MTEEMQKLRQAADEIDAILRKHDLIGYAVAQGKNNAQYVYCMDSDWTCISHTKNTDSKQVEFRVKSKAGSGDKEEIERLKNTVGAIMTMIDVTKHITEQMEKMAQCFASAGITFSHYTKKLD